MNTPEIPFDNSALRAPRSALPLQSANQRTAGQSGDDPGRKPAASEHSSAAPSPAALLSQSEELTTTEISRKAAVVMMNADIVAAHLEREQAALEQSLRDAFAVSKKEFRRGSR